MNGIYFYKLSILQVNIRPRGWEGFKILGHIFLLIGSRSSFYL